MIILSDEMLLESKSVRENQLKNISHDCSTEILNKTLSPQTLVVIGKIPIRGCPASGKTLVVKGFS